MYCNILVKAKEGVAYRNRDDTCLNVKVQERGTHYLEGVSCVWEVKSYKKRKPVHNFFYLTFSEIVFL